MHISLARIGLLFACAAASARAQSVCDTAALLASDAAAGNQLHLLDAEGDLALAGSFFHEEQGLTTGAAYLFRRQASGAWSQEAQLLPPFLPGLTYFGAGGAIEGDRIAIGATLDSDLGEQAGAVWIYRNGPSGWAVEAKLHMTDGGPFDQFGSRLSMSGPYLFVGVPWDDDAGQQAGAVCVFRGDPSGQWSQVAKLIGVGIEANTNFGSSVCVKGSLAIVGAPGMATSGGFLQGGAFVYRLESGTWKESGPLPTGPLQSATYFGSSAAIDGQRVAVGAPGNGGVLPVTGFVRIYEPDTSGAWIQSAEIASPVGQQSAQFGRSVALSGDWLVAGAPFQTTSTLFEGVAHVFRQSSGTWSHVTELSAANGQYYDQYGEEVRLAGPTVLVGEPGSPLAAPDAGAVHAFEFTDAAALNGCPKHLSVAAGGTQALRLDAGPAHAGELYLVLGSVSGTSPGLSVDGLLLPLNVDAYFLLTLSSPNTPLLSGSLGFTSPTGTALAHLNVPAGADPALAGLQVHHAAVVLSWPGTGALSFASNAAPLFLLP